MLREKERGGRRGVLREREALGNLHPMSGRVHPSSGSAFPVYLGTISLVPQGLLAGSSLISPERRWCLLMDPATSPDGRLLRFRTDRSTWAEIRGEPTAKVQCLAYCPLKEPLAFAVHGNLGAYAIIIIQFVLSRLDLLCETPIVDTALR